MKSRKKPPFVKQESRNDCGAACFSSVAGYFGTDIPLELARELCDTRQTGTSIKQLAEGAKAVGLEADGYLVEEFSDLSPTLLPLLLHIESQPGEGHFIVLWNIESGLRKVKYRCVDPAHGYISLSQEQLAACWKSRACLRLFPGKRFQPIRLGLRQKIRWIRDLLREESNHFMSILFMGIVVALLNVVLTLFVQRLVDEYIPQKAVQELQLGLACLIFLLFGKEYLTRIRLRLIHRQVAVFNRKMFDWFHRKLLSLPARYFETHSIGDFNIRFQDAQKVQRILFALFNTILIDGLLLILLLLLLSRYDWRIGVVLSLYSLVYIAWFRRITQPLHKKQITIINANTKFEEWFISFLWAIKVFKFFNKEYWVADRMSKANEQLQDAVKAYGYSIAVLSFWSGIFCVPVLMGLIYYTAVSAMAGTITVGELVSIIGFTSLIFPLVNSLASAIVPLKEAALAFNRLSEFNLLSTQVSEGLQPVQVIQSISLDAVHPLISAAAQKRLGGTIKKGSLVAVIGKNGTGKTSLLNVLAGLKQHYQGTIWINHEKELRAIDASSWFQRIAMVPQEVQLFEGSILENIGFDDAVLNPEKIMEFLRRVGFLVFFDRFPHGVNTQIGDKTGAVSGGQKQLIALARALYREPDLLLLDEATTALDKEAAEFVYTLLHTIKSGMLILFVSHRDAAFVKGCDIVWEMD